MQSKFKELYFLESIDEEIDSILTKDSDFIFCGKNWGFYFISKVHNDCEKIENVELKKGNYNKKDPVWIDYDQELDLNLIYTKND